MEGLREYQVAGLVELKKDYEARLVELEGFADLATDFHAAALRLVKSAVDQAGIDPLLSPPLAIAEAEMRTVFDDDFGVLRAAGGCGFCRVCITDCATCVFGAPRA